MQTKYSISHKHNFSHVQKCYVLFIKNPFYMLAFYKILNPSAVYFKFLCGILTEKCKYEICLSMYIIYEINTTQYPHKPPPPQGFSIKASHARLILSYSVLQSVSLSHLLLLQWTQPLNYDVKIYYHILVS